jgi:hypothetical protein
VSPWSQAEIFYQVGVPVTDAFLEGYHGGAVQVVIYALHKLNCTPDLSGLYRG